MKQPPTLQRLTELLDYDQHTGIWRWRVRRGGAKHIAGSRSLAGYIQIRIDRQLFMAHQLAWLYVHGRWPVTDIDHKNRDPADNRIANLRLATHQQNLANSSKRHCNTSGYKGVSYDRGSGKWHAELAHRKLGRYATREQAAQAYLTAAIKKYGEFAGS